MVSRASKAGTELEDVPTPQIPRYAIKTTYLTLTLGAMTAVAFSYLGFSFQGRKIDPLDYEARAKHILDTTPLVDGHNDLPYLLRIELQNKIYDSTEFNFWDGKKQFLLHDLRIYHFQRVGSGC